MRVEYITHSGSDLLVVNSARVSFNKQKDVFTDEDSKLISYLAKHEHWTPFAHPQITIRETVPIFVARQRMRSNVGFVYNETSRRYVDDAPELYAPDVWRSRPQGSLKQGSGEAIQHNQVASDVYSRALQAAESAYNELLAMNVAPEQARMVLPQSMFTSYYVTGSLAAFARAYKLRIDSHAQKEIQELAVEWNRVIAPLFPVSWAALTV
jgi:thymidylate synthase (FAD)